MLYEFQYLPVGQAFAAARHAGADVDIRYEAQTYHEENVAMIAEAGIENIAKPQQSRGGIRHNKFIVLIHREPPSGCGRGPPTSPRAASSGTPTSGTPSGTRTIAQRYLDYWERLAGPDVTRAPLVAANLLVELTPAPDPSSR